MEKKTIIICGFPGIGKSTFFKEFGEKYECYDNDSSNYDDKFFPNNYIFDIEENIGKYDYIFVSTHEDVIDLLCKKGIKHSIFYPSKESREIYIKNYRKRGNNSDFVDNLEMNFFDWINDLDNRYNKIDPNVERLYKLRVGRYLSDVIPFMSLPYNERKIEEKEESIKDEFKPLVFAIDFDGTCVKNAFPEVGEDIGAEIIIRKLQEKGHKIVLNTVRSNKSDKNEMHLDAAVNWFKEKEITLFGINENPEQKEFSLSPKVYANYYIDDKSLGTPCKVDSEDPYVDWSSIEKILIEKGIL